MARQHIGKILSGGVMFLCVMSWFTPATYSQGTVARMKTFTISGNVGLPGVTMQGLPGEPTSDENGVYTAEVNYNWSGTVQPVKTGYTFEPKQKSYQNVKADQSNENYSADLMKFTVSGSVGQPGVTMNGFPDNPVTDASGRFSTTVEYGWSGMVIPEKIGYQFEPGSKVYAPVERDLRSETYVAKEVRFTISGSAGAEGVTMKGLPGNPVTAGGGTYRVEVPYGWSGTVTPTKDGHTFTPSSKDYSDVLEPRTNENYTAHVSMFRISGSVGLPGVTLEGLPDNPMTDMDGSYAVSVPYGWDGKVTPVRAGYTFKPASKAYTKVVVDRENENYSAEIVQLTISGNTGTGGVKLEGLPGDPTSDATGFYTVKVEYAWSGTVTPVKEGWSFDPGNLMFSSITADRTNQNFKGTPITYTISGNVGLANVMMDGLPNRPVTGADGSYSAIVPHKWKGTVTPRRPGYTFEPGSRSYEELLISQMSQDFQASAIQLTVSGKVMSETGPVANVNVVADNNGGTAITDGNGEYQLSVDYGWRGRITPTRDGYTFTPANRMLETVAQNVPNVSFTGRVRMMTIIDSIVFDGTEPIEGVTITADPGGTTAITNLEGKYTIQVPYGWTGDLVFAKEGFEFDPASISYLNVTENIDRTAPARTTPPAQRPADVTPPARTPVEQPPSMSTTPDTETDPERRRLMTEIERLLQENQALRTLSDGPDAQPGLEDELPTVQSQPPTRTPSQPGRLLAPATAGYTVLDVLTRIYEQTGVKIAVDATVKPTPISIDFDISLLTPAQVPLALQRTLEQTSYKFKAVGDTYLVYMPITNTFQGDDLRTVLQTVAMTAGVTIVPDPNVFGEVFADLHEVDLDTALRIILAGSPFVVQRTPDYYLVADRGVGSDAFAEISETHNVFLNYRVPVRVTELLSSAFTSYVRVSNDPNSRVVSVTAPPDLARRIVNEIKRLDLKPRHVLLDARVVVMERNDLLNVGVEWGWPQISMGAFGTSFDLDNGGGSWPWGIQMGYTPDGTFTNSLLMALNLLQQNGQADVVSNPQVLAQDGRMSELGVLTEEYYILTPQTANLGTFYMQSEMVMIESGTKLSIMPRIGDNNDITLEMATEVSDSIPSGSSTQLPVVTRRTARNVVTVKDGGTVALAGLTESRSRKTDKRVPGLSNLPLLGGLFKNTDGTQVSKEIAVFVTAHLVPDGTTVRASSPQIQPLPLGTGASGQAPRSGLSDADIRDSITRLR
ncbi:hypothetical protein [Anaerobaca lacustris]|uniref:Type II/III secretion system secretin-like domain-containing protein n=1 Tax=Anaerobaca lacustris TaxID=3044600 RepID=A0AAW6TY14_9BACT|nr:hypothetical protein [Sedimentisphaerales bacterium M17dextr]